LIPEEISYKDLLTVFFFEHDPTTLNKQGADVGEQYRSVIYYMSENQKKMADDFIKELEEGKAYDKSIMTYVLPFVNFYPAESYHKNYYENNKNSNYCELVITSKIERLEKRFGELLKNQN